ncbi:MAG: T9SS type A sorting domain-containing protein [Algibacter sp.]
MNTKLHTLIALLLTICMAWGQEITVNASMEASYSNQLFYKLSTETETSYVANSWDIAMLRTSAFDIALRINDGIGTEVFEASSSSGDWAAIDISNEANWTQLYNSDTNWTNGAFDNGSATYGWGEYNISNHHVVGTVIYVLKYTDGTYIKFINEDFYDGYTFKYSTWNNDTSIWEADQSATVSNASNPNNQFNYYSFDSNVEVVAEPATTDWDIKFTKYYTEVSDGSGGTTPYLVTGVLFNDALEVAKNDEPTGMPANPTLSYSTDINTIGWDWKTFNFSSFTYDVSSNQAFYIKYADGTVYRLYFTSFSGSSSGDVTFKFEDVTASLGIDDLSSSDISFGVFPNPSTDKKVNLMYDISKLNSSKNEVSIYSTTGQKVFETSLNNTSSFSNKTLDLSSLKSGIYVLQFNSGNYSTIKKIVLN